MKLKKYLDIINPIISVVVFVLCIWAAIVDEGKFAPLGILQGGFAMYFVAKGLFCGSALFILGKLLSEKLK